jgi:hypothetical protein
MITSLSKTDLRKFIKMCSEDRGSGDFEIYLGLSRNEVSRIKGSLGISSPADAKDLLKDVVVLEEKEEELHRIERQAILTQEREAAQKRLDEANLRRQEEKLTRKKRVLSVTKVKNQDKKRQEKFDKQNAKKEVKQKAWKLPAEIDSDRFKRDLMTRGIRFICDQYQITRNDIMNEAARLKLKINFDLVPR